MFGVLVVSAFLIGINGLFVLMEFALVKVRSSRIEVLARKGDARALMVRDMLTHLDFYLSAIQLGLTVIGLALGWIAEPTLAHWVGHLLERLPFTPPERLVHAASFALALLMLAFVNIVLGELIPRSMGIQKAEVLSLWGAYPLRLFAVFFRVPVTFMSFCSLSVLKLLGLKPAAESESAVSEEEMRVLLGETQEKGALPLERLLLLENLFDLGTAHASEAMVPLDKVAFLSLKKSWEENLAVIRSRHFSRYPLCEDGPEKVLGFVHVKDILLKGENGAAPELKHIRRDMTVVSENEPLEKLLKQFPDKGIHMAMVAKTTGELCGLLTLEDIVEELIGEVHDEFDLPLAWSLMDVVVPSAVAVALQAGDRLEAIGLLVAKLKAAFPEFNEAEALKAVWDREGKFSSAVGRGIAVPHARLPDLARPMVAVGRFSKPAPFPSPDNVPVRLVFLILTPSGAPIIQLKVLARIASLATNENLRRKLLKAKTADSMLDILRTADTLLAA